MYDNYNYPAGADNELAPWNQPVIPEKTFEITVSQTLSKNAEVITNNYIPTKTVERMNNLCEEYDDTSDTDWADEYLNTNSHYTPIQLINMYKESLKEELKSWEGLEKTYAGHTNIKRIEHLIEECEGWCDDETEFVK